MTKRRAYLAGAVLIATLGGMLASAPFAGAASSQGVTATTIRVGVPYVDVAAVKAVGVDLNWGNVTDAYKAVFANINAHGGINGRKIVPFIVAVDPTGSAPAATACTQLTQDDKVFVALAPLAPTCYLQAGVPTINALGPPATTTGLAKNFSLAPPPATYDPLELSVFKKQGVFKNKKVAIFAGVTADQPELTLVQSALKKLGVPVVATAVDSATQGDLTAENQQGSVIAQKFQSDGANEIVTVGYGGAVWPEVLSAIQSSYNPPWVATSEGDLSGDVAGSDDPKYLSNVVTSSPIPGPQTIWDDPLVQACVKLARKAYPADHINNYKPGLPGSQITYTGIEQACTDVSLFNSIAKAAGKNLTLSSFVKAAYGLRNVAVPGAGKVSFAPNQPFASGPVYMVHYDPSSKTLVFATKSSS